MLFTALQAQSRLARVRGLLLILLFMGSFFAVGCGETLPPLAPVKGSVTVGDKKLTSGQISLMPEVVPDAKVPPSSGKIDADGNFEIKTGGKSGAPLGKYKVAISPDMSQPRDKGQTDSFDVMKYGSAVKSGLAFEVIDNPAAGRYDLKLTK